MVDSSTDHIGTTSRYRVPIPQPPEFAQQLQVFPSLHTLYTLQGFAFTENTVALGNIIEATPRSYCAHKPVSAQQ